MGNFNNISPDKMNAMIKIVSAKTGKSEEEIRNIVSSGKADALIQGLDEGKKKQLANLMNNPGQVEKLLSNPAIRSMISKYLK